MCRILAIFLFFFTLNQRFLIGEELSSFGSISELEYHANLSHADKAQIIQHLVVSQWEKIEGLSLEISSTADSLNALPLVKKRGILYFSIGEMDLALEDFNQILNVLLIHQKNDRQLIGTALWGRLLCHAFSGFSQEAYDDIHKVELFFVANADCKNQDLEDREVALGAGSLEGLILPVAKFAHPNEKISSEECRSRVYRTAQAMRTIILKVPNVFVQCSVTYLIDELSQVGLSCCKNPSNWTSCLEPIVDAWHNLQDLWEQLADLLSKGIAINPHILARRPS